MPEKAIIKEGSDLLRLPFNEAQAYMPEKGEVSS